MINESFHRAKKAEVLFIEQQTLLYLAAHFFGACLLADIFHHLKLLSMSICRKKDKLSMPIYAIQSI